MDSVSQHTSAPLLSLGDRQSLRAHMRGLRMALTEQQQKQAGERIAERAMELPLFKRAEHIALYLPFDGEISTETLINLLWERNKCVYLPVINPYPKKHLLFVHYTPDTPLRLNTFRILEPYTDASRIIPIQKLDVIVVPLVAFDEGGRRLGMGSGFYDRTLGNWKENRQHKEGPFLIGLAHDCQQIPTVPTESWDVPLPVILSPSKLWNFQHLYA